MSESIIVNATKDQIEEFKSSVLWQDIVRELGAWAEGFNRELSTIVDDSSRDNPSTASVLMHLGDINGRQKAIQYLLGILDIFLDLKSEQKQEDKD
jgi:hypothetical protein